MKVNKNQRKRSVKKVSKPKDSFGKSYSAPVAKSKVIKHLGEPKIDRLGKSGDCVVSHREYIGDIQSSGSPGAFAVTGIPINPGNSSMFPWLSVMADDYESYRFRKLRFHYETLSPTSTAGVALLAVDFDPSDALPASKRDMMSFRDACRGAPWEDFFIDCKSEDLHKRASYFINEDSSSNILLLDDETLSDRRLDDVGELLIGSSGLATAYANLGEAYVEYEIELLTPQTSGVLAPVYIMKSFNDSAGSIGMSQTLPFGTPSKFNNAEPRFQVFDALPVLASDTGGATRFEILQPGTFLITATVLGYSHAIAGGLSGPASTSGGNALFNVCAPQVKETSGLDFSWAGMYVVRNTAALNSNGALGFIDFSLTAVGTFQSTATGSVRIVAMPSWDTYRSDSTGWINLNYAKPPPTLWARSKAIRKRYSPWYVEGRTSIDSLAGSSGLTSPEESPPSEMKGKEDRTAVGLVKGRCFPPSFS